MKKIVLAFGAVALLAMFSLTSCNKLCTCDTWLDGEIISTRTDVEPNAGGKCSDMTKLDIDNDDHKTGLECE